MALAQLCTRGYSTGSNGGTVNLVAVRGYAVGAAAPVVSDLPQPGGGGRRAWKDKRQRDEKNVYVPLDDATIKDLFPGEKQAPTAPKTIMAAAQVASPAMSTAPIPLAQPATMDPALVAAVFDVFDQLDED